MAQKELNTVRIPFKSYEDIYYSRKWMLNYGGNPIAEKDQPLLKKYMEDWSEVWMPTWNEVLELNLFLDLPTIKCPVYFFLGEKDLQTNCNIARDYYEILKAPRKNIYTFKNAGHSVLADEAEQVQRIIMDQILKSSDNVLQN